MLSILFVSILLLQAPLTSSKSIYVSNGAPWGKWGNTHFCPEDTIARGFNLLVERPQGGSDDTAVNGIELYCAKANSTEKLATISSTKGSWGEWTGERWCPKYAFLVSFALKVEQPYGNGDNTAANNILFLCSDFTVLEGWGTLWGHWGRLSDPCKSGINGITTKVESPQGWTGDDTALNDVKMECKTR